MARVLAYRGFDQLNFDLSVLYYNSLDLQFDDNLYLERDGRLLEDLLTVAYEFGGTMYGIGFAGRGFRLDGDRITGGTVQVLAEVGEIDGIYEELWEMDGLNLPLVDIYNASMTRSTADDARVIDRMLSGNDLFELSFEDDRAFGLAGNDTLRGFGSDDTLGGGTGNDLLLGGTGNDRLMLDSGNDILRGGAGSDWVVAQGASAVRIDLAVTGRQDTRQGQDIIVEIENASGGAGNDTLSGNAQANILQGGAGSDVLSGRAGNDRLVGMAGNDRLDGGDGFDVLLGDAGADTLIGGRGNDRLDGGAGNDRLLGGTGADVLTGGAGADVFVFASIGDSSPGRGDLITDFRSGTDRIDLRAIDADGRAAGNQAFDFDGFGPLQPGSTGQLTFRHVHTGGGRETQVLLNTDGDGRAEGIIRLAGVLTLSETDFIL